MNLLILNEKIIYDIVGSLTVSETIKNIIKNTILRYDYSYTNFIYSVFSVYTNYYVQLSEYSDEISTEEKEAIFKSLVRIKKPLNKNNIFISDVYDMLFVMSSYERERFKPYFYEDIYNRVVNLYGNSVADTHIESVIDVLETIFLSVESNIISSLIDDSNNKSNVVIYLELNSYGLMIYIL